MTTKTRQIEEKFNKRFPVIKQADNIGKAEPTKFDRTRFLKAAKELRQVVKENDDRESTEP